MRTPEQRARIVAGALKARSHRVCPRCAKKLFSNAGGFNTHLRYCGDESRFWNRVNKNGPNGCWVWMGGAKDKWGYGDIRWMDKHVQAHRLSWRLLKGEPGALDVLHKCDNPPCCNPDHLYLGTDADNHRDMRERGRANYTSRAKLNHDQVREIRRDWTGKNADELAERYKIAPSTIYCAATRRSWPNVK